MWPLIAVLGLVLAFGAISGGNFSPNTAEADITLYDDVFDGEQPAAVYWFNQLEDFGDNQSGDCDDDDQLVAGLWENIGELDESDTIYLAVDGQNEIWICVELYEGWSDFLEFDSDDYGTWEEALCADQDGDSDFENTDDCDDTTGLGTDTLTIDCEDQADCEADQYPDGDVAVRFECDADDGGIADVTISHGEDENEFGQVHFRIICFKETDGADGKITCEPCKVEIVPALGSTQYSLIYVKLLDEDDKAARPGANVTWLTDNCEISDDPIAAWDQEDQEWTLNLLTEDDEDLDTFDEIIDIFEEYRKTPTPANADDIHDFIDDYFDPDWDDEGEDVTFIEEPFDDDDPFKDMDTFAAVFLNCGQGHDSKPGIATVTAIVEVLDDPDLVFEVEVTVIGPAAGPIVVTADPSGSVRCGERVQITATIKDAKGTPVSDHTLLEAVTNFGGILGGTGAVAGQQGLVTPVASTVAETFGGVATFWLLTSETHAGPYEVIVSTGGGGAVAGFFGTSDGNNFDVDDEGSESRRRNPGTSIFDFDSDSQYQPRLGGLFSTPVVNGRVAVACTIPAAVAPAPAATVRAPSTGGGIVPPNTGDAGLADASGNSMMLFVIAGVAVVAIAGVAGVKLVRR